MTQKKKSAVKKGIPPKQGIKLVKLSSLPKAEIAKINIDSLWIMKPPAAMMAPIRTKKARYCGCRNVCLV
jgi:hypothetical protein